MGKGEETRGREGGRAGGKGGRKERKRERGGGARKEKGREGGVGGERGFVCFLLSVCVLYMHVTKRFTLHIHVLYQSVVRVAIHIQRQACDKVDGC